MVLYNPNILFNYSYSNCTKQRHFYFNNIINAGILQYELGNLEDIIGVKMVQFTAIAIVY